MSDFRYRNKNTGQVVEYDHASPRLEALDNWETLTIHGQDASTDDLVDQFGAPRSSLLLGKGPERVPPPPANVGPPPAGDPDTLPPTTGGDDPDTQPPADNSPADEFTPLPPKSANKEAWVVVAMERGQMSREEAEAMTKPDLIDVFGEGDA